MEELKFIKASLEESSDVKIKMIKENGEDIVKASNVIVQTFKNKNKILLCGNGGSAADCQHIAAEFIIRLSHKISRPSLPAIALTVDSSILTAAGNDIGFENVFARSIEGLAQKGDALIVISTSGNSENIIRGVKQAAKMNVFTIGLLGGNGGKLNSILDLPIIVPSSSVQRIQEGHITMAHIICELVETKLFL